jgi:hypothetical protein
MGVSFKKLLGPKKSPARGGAGLSKPVELRGRERFAESETQLRNREKVPLYPPQAALTYSPV